MKKECNAILNTVKTCVISLGCDKNRVDTEKMLSFLPDNFSVSNQEDDADLIIINTCAFLESSRKEAIEEILYAISLKKVNENLKIIVTGCLPQRYLNDIYSELPEVDAFLGVSDYDKIPNVLNKLFNGEKTCFVGTPKGEPTENRVLTTKYYAYLKIADGCSNHCTYCLIPSIRGKYRSVETDSLIREAKNLGHVRELILVAQDTTKYGQDLSEKSSLAQLIKRISALDNVDKIRLLYCYPENVSDELINEFKNNPKLIKYIDMPLQHADDKILKLMNRKGSGEAYLNLINKLRLQVPEIAIRSTFITGFPQEGEREFANLIEFIEKAQFFNAGFFAFSCEEGTAACKLQGQVEEKIKKKRLRKLYSVQKKVVKKINRSFVGKTINVLCEGFSEQTMTYFGRTYFNAPDIDGKVYFFSGEEVSYGSSVKVKITAFEDYDLYGEKI